MAQNEELKEDKKYLAILIGGSLLISLAAIIGGKLLSGTGMTGLVELGYAVEVLGWAWVAGTTAITLFIQARMRQLYETAPVRATK